jgi:hypothetical protein
VGFFFFSFFSFGWSENRIRKAIFGPKNCAIKPNPRLSQIKVCKIDCAQYLALGALSLLVAREHPSAGFQGKSLPDQKERAG